MTTQTDDMTPVIIGVGQFQMDVPDSFTDKPIVLLRLENDHHALAWLQGILSQLNNLEKGVTFSVSSTPKGNIVILA